MDTTLAIVIPAYKSDFLRDTLESIANQTCRDFHLYIGDDCSPHNLKRIVDDFTSRISVTYHRFDENIGAVSLVKHWERCISMTKDEKWIWLFSDDDVMGEQCVSLFYESLNQLKQGTNYDLYHFDVKIIDTHSTVKGIRKPYPQDWSSFQFYQGITSCKYSNTAAEYIFSRDIYVREDGFTEFDLGWGSDIATWTKFSSRTGMHTLQGEYVYYRDSGVNISSNNSASVLSRKMLALLDLYRWSVAFFGHSEALFQTNYTYFRMRFHFFKYCPINWYGYIKQFYEIHRKGVNIRLLKNILVVSLMKFKANVRRLLRLSYLY